MADLSGILLPTDLSAQGLSAADGRQLKSYLYQLTEQLRYVLGNLDGENMSAAYNDSLAGTDTRLAALTRQQQADIAALRTALSQTAERLAGADAAHRADAAAFAARLDALAAWITPGETLRLGTARQPLVLDETGAALPDARLTGTLTLPGGDAGAFICRTNGTGFGIEWRDG